MRRRRILSILLIATLSALLVACGDDGADRVRRASTTASTTTYLHHVDDHDGPGDDGPGGLAAGGRLRSPTTTPWRPPPGSRPSWWASPTRWSGEFQQGDSRSGEVPVRAASNGPVTTVLVRQLGDDGSWSVLGAIDRRRSVPTTPAAGATVTSPAQLAGTSTAFEGTVQVAVHGRVAGDPLGTGFVTGGSMGDMGPFESTVEFSAPHDRRRFDRVHHRVDGGRPGVGGRRRPGRVRRELRSLRGIPSPTRSNALH